MEAAFQNDGNDAGMDFGKDYDQVFRDVLLEIMKVYSEGGNLLKKMELFYSDETAVAKIRGYESVTMEWNWEWAKGV